MIGVARLATVGCVLGALAGACAHAQDGDVPWSSSARETPGEVVWLEAPGDRFPALYAPAASASPVGAVLIAHGLGRHADWPALVRPLRLALARGGWHTLSVQLPAASADTPIERQQELPALAAARLAAGHGHLVAQGIANIALVGHRWGAAVAALFLESGVPAGVTAYVALAPAFSVPGPDRRRVIEILEERELPVLVMVPVEAPVAEPPQILPRPPKGDAPRRRVVIDTADETLGDSAETVIKRVRAWLAQHARPPP